MESNLQEVCVYERTQCHAEEQSPGTITPVGVDASPEESKNDAASDECRQESRESTLNIMLLPNKLGVVVRYIDIS